MVLFEERKYGIPLYQCPSFLFFLMGIFITFSSLTIYLIGTKFIETPEIVALIVLLVAAFLLIISFLITNSFEKLLQANRLKSEFVGIVSHQLRAPISNFKWILEFILSGRVGRVSEKQLEYLQILRENSQRMFEMVKDLLLVSKLEIPTLFFKKEKFSLSDLVKEIVEDFKFFALAHNVQIQTFFQENLPKIFAPKEQIKKAIENLLENAIIYSKGKGIVKIKIEKRGKFIYFEIEDNGIGIPKEDQKFIFQKFFRASNASKVKTQGTGLGLYITKMIVEKSGGKIGFSSKEGQGSVFWFYLPIK